MWNVATTRTTLVQNAAAKRTTLVQNVAVGKSGDKRVLTRYPAKIVRAFLRATAKAGIRTAVEAFGSELGAAIVRWWEARMQPDERDEDEDESEDSDSAA